MQADSNCSKFARSNEYEYRHFFEYAAKIYDLGLKVLTLGKETLIRQKLIKTAVGMLKSHSTKNLTVLDLCTGTGSLAIMFKKMYPSSNVYGVDVSEGMLSIAKEKARKDNLSIYLKKCDVQALPFPDENFDIVMVSLCMHELPLTIRNQVLREILRVLKNEGILAVFDYGHQQSLIQKVVYSLLMSVEEESAKEFLSKPFSKDLMQNGFRVLFHTRTFYGFLEYYFAKKEAK